MRIVTITKNVYQFHELPADTQSHILQRWRNDNYFPWDEEWRDSLNGFCQIAPIVNVKWEVGIWGRSFATCEVRDEAVSELSGIRAWKWLLNNGLFDEKLISGNCPFTGYCGDEDLLDAIRKAKVNPAGIISLHELFNDCLHSWAMAYEADMEYFHSEKAIIEEIEANEYEFYENGAVA